MAGAVSLLLLLSGCGNKAAENAQGAVTFSDDRGREITLGNVEKAAALIGSFADVWCLAGGKDTIVAAADDTWTQFGGGGGARGRIGTWFDAPKIILL